MNVLTNALHRLCWCYPIDMRSVSEIRAYEELVSRGWAVRTYDNHLLPTAKGLHEYYGRFGK